MDVDVQELVKTYSEYTDEKLLSMASSGTLTEVAYKVLEKELSQRGIPIPQQVDEVDATRNTKINRLSIICWLLIGIGAVTPLIVGLVVKFYLMSQGVETVPFRNAIFIFPLVLYWVIPFALLAGYAHTFLSGRHGLPFWKRTLVISFGAVFGWVTMVVVFWGGWQVHGVLALVFAPILVGVAILWGLAIGFIVAKDIL